MKYQTTGKARAVERQDIHGARAICDGHQLPLSTYRVVPVGITVEGATS